MTVLKLQRKVLIQFSAFQHVVLSTNFHKREGGWTTSGIRRLPHQKHTSVPITLHCGSTHYTVPISPTSQWVPLLGESTRGLSGWILRNPRRVARQWYRLPRELQESLCLEVFESCADVALRGTGHGGVGWGWRQKHQPPVSHHGWSCTHSHHSPLLFLGYWNTVTDMVPLLRAAPGRGTSTVSWQPHGVPDWPKGEQLQPQTWGPWKIICSHRSTISSMMMDCRWSSLIRVLIFMCIVISTTHSPVCLQHER